MMINNKYKIIMILGLTLTVGAIASNISKVFSFSPGNTITSSQVNTNFDQIFSEINLKDARLGAIEANNWVTSDRIQNGNVTAAKIAPNAVVSPETTRTINFDNTMTAAQVQALVDGVGKYVPDGVTLTFQFADGTYVLNQSITFDGFFGNGLIDIRGNIAEAGAATLHTTQVVVLDFSGGVGGLRVNNSRLGAVTLRNFNILVTSNVPGRYPIAISNSSEVYVQYSYLRGNSTAGPSSDGVLCSNDAWCAVSNTYISNIYFAFEVGWGSWLFSDNNDDTGTMPVYTYAVASGSSVVRTGGAQPAASTGMTFNYGGVGVY